MRLSRVETAIFAIVLLLFSGTVIFHLLEGWSWVDSFYFTGTSLLTVGYGDLVPKQDLSKILTVFFGFFAIGIALYALSIIGQAVHNNIPFSEDHQKALAQAKKRTGSK